MFNFKHSPFSIVGTYDAYCVPLLLPKSTILSLLPKHLRDRGDAVFCSNEVVREFLREAGGEELDVPEDKHPVMLILGRQLRTGPWVLFKSTFQVR